MDKQIWIDGIMGLVVGDACGVPVEFKSRLALKREPVVDMREYGTHQQPRGTWSDDSSMALATLASLHKGYNLKDIAEQFVKWDKEAMYTPFGEVFDMGITCTNAISRFQDSGDPYTCGGSDEMDNGNGSLMRILPICLYAYSQVKKGKIDEHMAVDMVHEVSALTHAHLRSKMACGLYYFCVKTILEQKNQLSVSECLQKGFDEGFVWYAGVKENLSEVKQFERLSNMKEFANADEESIRASGYVLDSLEASIWCLLNTESFEEAVLKAVNLGDDTDTVGAIVGGLAGLYYGYESIPINWRECIVQKNWILELCDFNQKNV